MRNAAPARTATSSVRTDRTSAHPGRLRRTALVATGLLACAIPVVFTAELTRMLLVGELPEHRFHQLTGQGLLLCALWLGGLLPLLRAGWSGRRPSVVTGALHAVVVATGAACAVASPRGGAPVLVGVLAVTGALLWTALPTRPRLHLRVQVDPVLAPLWLVAAALTMPYVLAQIALQNAATGHHADNPHFFDMAWLALALVTLGVLAAVLPALRRLGPVAGAGLTWTGAVGTALGTDRPWTLVALVAGLCAVVLSVALARRPERAREAGSLI
ncbi:MAG TPA: hypothetical protein VER39_00440 [Nocardioidaceae bacterium]|nr:hypothetical protein [Nocardioidaceae bacterium]